MERSRFWSLPVALALVGVLAAAPPARGSDSIDPGETIKDKITYNNQYKEFTFDGNEDDYVTIFLLDKEDLDEFDPVVQLSSPSGVVAQDGDSGAAMIRSYRLREDGEYTIAVGTSSYWCYFLCPDHYDFTLSLISTGSTNDGGAISYGQTIGAGTSPSGDLDGYRFYGKDGDDITIRVTKTGGGSHFKPCVDLVGPDGLVDTDNDSNEAVIHRTLDQNGDFTIIVWGGDSDGASGTYNLQLVGPGGVVPTPTPIPIPTPTPLPLPDLTVAHSDFSPASPARVKPGDPVVLGSYVENLGVAAGPFWLEFWGSRTGGLTLDAFLADSQYIPGLGVQGADPLELARSLYGVPDGPWSVTIVLDRPGMVNEWSEANNRYVVPGKRLLVLRPPSNVDLAVEGFGIAPLPPHAGQVANLSGTVRNLGTEASGSFWIEFWRTGAPVYPQPDSMLCDSIRISDLAPSATVSLAAYPRVIYSGVPLDGQIGCVVDRLDTVNETDETNNCQFVRTGPSPGTPVLDVTSVNFTPSSPEMQPGMMLSISGSVVNHGAGAAGPFWLEFWGSRTGGLTLDAFLLDSLAANGLAAGAQYDFQVNSPAYAIPDGPYTVVVTANRPAAENYGRRAVAGQRLLMIRPQTQANLKIEGFGFGPSSTIVRGSALTMSGIVRNAGSEAAGPFWIEFWGSSSQQAPTLDWFVTDSIWIGGLAPGAGVNLSGYPRTIYGTMPTGPCAIGCFVDRTDMVNESDESDNYSFISGFQIF